MAKFKTKDRVLLKANVEENWSRAYGIIIEVENQNKYPGMYIVQITEIDIPMEDSDDGIREIHEDNITLQPKYGKLNYSLK